MKFLSILFILSPLFVICQITGKVVGITDGDTFTLLTEKNQQIKIRFYGIDCPEKGQEYGSQCKIFLSNLIFSKQVKIETKGLDRYKRTLAIVFLKDVNINEEMLINGMAWHFTKYDKNTKWEKMQQTAKQKKLGLWSLHNSIPPWDWRKKKFTYSPRFI